METDHAGKTIAGAVSGDSPPCPPVFRAQWSHGITRGDGLALCGPQVGRAISSHTYVPSGSTIPTGDCVSVAISSAPRRPCKRPRGVPIPPAENTLLDQATHIIARARRIGPIEHDRAGATGIAEICFDVSVTLRQLGLAVKGSLDVDASSALREAFVSFPRLLTV
jgi:hypothetical protein